MGLELVGIGMFPSSDPVLVSMRRTAGRVVIGQLLDGQVLTANSVSSPDSAVLNELAIGTPGLNGT